MVPTMYLGLKYAHVLIAIVALGASTAVGVILGVFADDATHGEFALRIARRLLWIVAAGYVLMLATGLWMGHVAHLLDAHWTEVAMNIWAAGAVFIGLTMRSVQRQSRAPSGREALLGRCYAAGWALVLVILLYFMVFKPA
jgi:hypothetical protein